MTLLATINGCEIWRVRETYGYDYYVYGPYDSGDPRICSSYSMACDIAASA